MNGTTLGRFQQRYALSICSGDFSEWVWKTTNVLDKHSYILTPEYDMSAFNFANFINYDDLADLMAPRPFMVERGHDDVVGLDQWVAFEHANVREFYDKMGISNRTEIELFNGPHTIHGVGTFSIPPPPSEMARAVVASHPVNLRAGE